MSWLRRFVFIVVLLLIVGAGGGWAFLAGSLPRTSGTLILAELTAPVAVVRDAAGIPTIRAQSTRDLYTALGFVHAQDRLFQMDQQRRLVQGRLSEVFGPKALTTDRALRTLGLYRYAAATVPLISSEFMGVLDAYAAGVNCEEWQPTHPNVLELLSYRAKFVATRFNAPHSITRIFVTLL